MEEYTEPGVAKPKQQKPYVEIALGILIVLMLVYKISRTEEPVEANKVAPIIVQTEPKPAESSETVSAPFVPVTPPVVVVAPTKAAELSQRVARVNRISKSKKITLHKKEITKSKKIAVKKAKPAPVVQVDPTKVWEDMLLAAQTFRKSQNFSEAEAIMAELSLAESEGQLKLSKPREVLYYMEQGKLAFDQDQLARSVPQFKKAFELDPVNYSALKYLAGAQYRLGQYRESAATYDQAVKLDPVDSNTRLHLGMALFEAGQQDSAKDVLEDVLKRGTETGAGYYYLARIHQRKGDTQEALSMCEKALKVDPKNDKAQNLCNQLKPKTAS